MQQFRPVYPGDLLLFLPVPCKIPYMRAAQSPDCIFFSLVVYFSATGNTERVAEMIAEVTGGDLFELELAVPYTDEDLNYNDDNSRVSQEHADEGLRNVELVSTTVEGFDEYENVFVGYPVWWGIAAWPV